jgi:ABC-type Fe3+/spermidine/putrescine transport system ATPase subunit
MLRLVRLEGFAGRDVLTLSGGEQQRVALARSLAPSPRLLMLDEPLGALDASLRVTLLAELGDILRQVGITVLYVTHDQAEAMTIASRIALIDAGKLMQAGPPAELIRSPANAFVASFLGLGALVPAWELGMDLDMKVLVRPAAVRMSPAAGHVPAQARLISRMVRPQGSTLRIGIRGRAGAEYPLEITVPPLGSHERWDPGSLRPVWIDPLLCQPLSR